MSLFDSIDASQEQYQNALAAFVKSISADDGAWLDFFESSTGQITQRMVAAMAAFMNYRFEFLRREGNLETAQMRSSIYLMASLLGYPVNRRIPPTMEINADWGGADAGAHSRDLPVATIGAYTAVPLANLDGLASGSNPYSLACGIGEWKSSAEIEVTAGNVEDWKTLEFEIGNFAVPNLSSVEINSVEYPFIFLNYRANAAAAIEPWADTTLVDTVDDFIGVAILATDTIWIETNHLGGVRLHFGSETFAKRIVAGLFSISFLEAPDDIANIRTLAETKSQVAGTNDWTINLQGTPPDDTPIISVVSQGGEEDSLEKLRNLIPQYHASLRRAVTEDDHKALLLGSNGDLISANAWIHTIDENLGVTTTGTTYDNPANAGGEDNLNDLTITPVQRGSVVITIDKGSPTALLARDSLSDGDLEGTGFDSGTVDYDTGAIEFELTDAPVAGLSIDISYKDAQAEGTVDLCYLFQDEHVFTGVTDPERVAMLNYMEQFRMLGFRLDLIDPRSIDLDIIVDIVLTPGNTSTGHIEADLTELVNRSCLQLGVTFHVADILKSALQIEGVHRAYLTQPAVDRSCDTDQYFRLKSLAITYHADTAFQGTVGAAAGTTASDDAGYTEN